MCYSWYVSQDPLEAQRAEGAFAFVQSELLKQWYPGFYEIVLLALRRPK